MKRIPVVGLLLLLLLLAGCSGSVELGGVYLMDEYEGEEETLKAFVDSLGYYVEAVEDGYNFTPIVLQDGELIALSEEPWGLLKAENNRYKVFLYIGDLFGVVNGQEAMEAELNRESFVFNYYMNLKALDDSLKGKIEGGGHSDTVHLKKIETGAQ